MYHKFIIAIYFGLLIMAIACHAEQLEQLPIETLTTDDIPDVVYPPTQFLNYPEDQIIKKKLLVTTQWQTFIFEKPLRINRNGVQGLHLAVYKPLYISTMDIHPLNNDCNSDACAENAFCLRRLSDGVIARPEIILIDDNSREIKIRPLGHLYPYYDATTMTIILRTFQGVNKPSPPFPEDITSFSAMRIRATAPFMVRYLYWNVDYDVGMSSNH